MLTTCMCVCVWAVVTCAQTHTYTILGVNWIEDSHLKHQE